MMHVDPNIGDALFADAFNHEFKRAVRGGLLYQQGDFFGRFYFQRFARVAGQPEQHVGRPVKKANGQLKQALQQTERVDCQWHKGLSKADGELLWDKLTDNEGGVADGDDDREFMDDYFPINGSNSRAYVD